MYTYETLSSNLVVQERYRNDSGVFPPPGTPQNVVENETLCNVDLGGKGVARFYANTKNWGNWVEHTLLALSETAESGRMIILCVPEDPFPGNNEFLDVKKFIVQADGIWVTTPKPIEWRPLQKVDPQYL